jgi:hypothetical protein
MTKSDSDTKLSEPSQKENRVETTTPTPTSGGDTKLPEPSGVEFEIGVQFLLADFNSIRAFKEQSISIGDKRIDVFLTITSASVVGLGLLSQTGIDYQSFLFVALFGSLSLLAMGIVVFVQVVDRDILIVDYIRAINRIRSYFADNAPHIRPFLLMPTSHEFPRYSWQSSNRRIPMVVNSLSTGAFAAFLYLLIQHSALPDFYSVLLAGIFFILTYTLHEIYASRLFNKAEIKAGESRTVSLFDSHKGFRRNK